MTSKTQGAAKAATKTVEDAVTVAKKTAEQVAKASAESYEQAVSMSKEQVAQANEALLRGYGDFAAFNKGGVEALMSAGNIWVKGCEDLSKEYFAFAQKTAERNAEVAKAILSAKTVQDVFDVQTSFAKQGLDSVMAESAKLSELSVKVANEAFQPLQKQLDSAVSKLVKPMAG